MDYFHTYPNAYLRYHASDMVFRIDSDAAYLVAPKARSRVAGYFHLAEHPNLTEDPTLNGAIMVECKTLRHVVSSAAEAEVAGVFHNAGMAIPLRHFLDCLNHHQPPTPIKTDNSTATAFVYNNIHQKRSKSWDMQYYWLRDRHTQRKFDIYWEQGIKNDADYFTKHHSTVDHRAKRSRYVKDKLHYLASDFYTILSRSPLSDHSAPSQDVLLPPGSIDEQTAVWPLVRAHTPADKTRALSVWARVLHTPRETKI